MNTEQVAQVVEVINSSTLAVETAMVILLSYQTEGERSVGATVESNGKGFSHRTEHRGTYFAKWVLGVTHRTPEHKVAKAITAYLASTPTERAQFGNSLSGRFVHQAREIALIHRAQLQDLLPSSRNDLEEELPQTLRWGNPDAVATLIFS